MRCRKHPTDLSCSVGVCASCLRERLLAIIAAQVQAEKQAAQLANAHAHAAFDDHPWKSDPPPLLFPRSVSPYMTRRKFDHSDDAAAEAEAESESGLPSHPRRRNHPHPHHHHNHNHHQQQQRFFSTPQIGPGRNDFETTRSYKKKSGRLSMFSNLFRSRSDKFNLDLDSSGPRFSSRASCDSSSASSYPSWITKMFGERRRKKQSRMMYIEDAVAIERKPCRVIGRGMSPAMEPDSEECESSPSAEASPGRWKRTPVSGPPTMRRIRHGHAVSGLAFCLSPLVRASPNHHWSQKGGFPPDTALAGEVRNPMKPHISTAASFCANRSRKLADFGRAYQTR